MYLKVSQELWLDILLQWVSVKMFLKKFHYLCVKLDIHNDNEILHEGMVEKIAIKTPCA